MRACVESCLLVRYSSCKDSCHIRLHTRLCQYHVYYMCSSFLCTCHGCLEYLVEEKRVNDMRACVHSLTVSVSVIVTHVTKTVSVHVFLAWVTNVFTVIASVSNMVTITITLISVAVSGTVILLVLDPVVINIRITCVT